MPLSVSCGNCGKSFKVADELAGRRVRCPACQSVVAVPSLSAGPPPVTAAEEAESVEAPRPKKKKRRDVAKKGNKTLLIVGGVAGAALLGFCCLGAGVGAWFLFLRGTPEKKLGGKWQFDQE